MRDDLSDLDLQPLPFRATGRRLTLLSGATSLAKSMHVQFADDAAPSPKRRRRFEITPNIKALALAAFLFLSMSGVQAFAATVAHSQAMLVDTISMGVDGLTYFCNIFVEFRKQDGGEHMKTQLFVSAISLSCLTYFTVTTLTDSWAVAGACYGFSEASAGVVSDGVNPYIVLGFAVAGIVFDIISLWSFRRSKKKTGGNREMNMMTALLHVGADFLRSSATLVMSLMVIVWHVDGECADATASLAVGATILLGAAKGYASWLGNLYGLLWPRDLAKGADDSDEQSSASDDVAVGNDGLEASV